MQQTSSAKIEQRIASELSVQAKQVSAAIALLDEGSTVPFISRYRKEATNGLDDTQLRTLEERLRYLRELEERRVAILKSIEEQDKLTGDLKTAILEAETKTTLEDLYLPYKPKRRTKGQIAIEAGLEPLADALYENPELDPEVEASKYLNKESGTDKQSVEDTKQALEGARYILMERFSENAELLGNVRQFLIDKGMVISTVAKDKEQEGAKFRDYFDYKELYKKVPSHRALALFRGRNEGFLYLSLNIEQEDPTASHPCELMIAKQWDIQHNNRPADEWLKQVVSWTWKIKILSHVELDLMGTLREKAEEEAIRVFAENMKDLMLAAPAGPRATIGLDPGLRTGVKVAVIDQTGKYLDQATIYPHVPQKKWDEAIAILAAIAKKHSIELISIGNGTASRETDKLAGELITKHPELKLTKIIVNEAGASVYSASEFAAKEFPDLDVTIRGAVSIARRLQDPLGELVKIEPKSVGVGQYQHDVNQFKLARSLDTAIEDCVNNVGVDINTASAPLLRRVSGLNETIANNIVEFRNQNGSFKDRQQINQVARFGEKSFEQSAGFLRIMNGDNPLDASSVHPEAYSVVTDIASKNQRDIKSLIGDSSFLKTVRAQEYTTEQFGVPTVTDIIQELEKPGRDPRPEFKTATFQDGIEQLKDLREGMVLEGTVTNVTNFGAFVDVGVHQDGLVHISALADKFVEDPRSIVKAGQIVKVKVMEVDLERKRVGLSMRMGDEPGSQDKKKPNITDRGPAPRKPQQQRVNSRKSNNHEPKNHQSKNRQSKNHQPKQEKMVNNVMANKLAAAFNKK